MKDVHTLACLGVMLEDSPSGGCLVHHNSESLFIVKVKSNQHLDLVYMKESVIYNLNETFSLGVVVF